MNKKTEEIMKNLLMIGAIIGALLVLTSCSVNTSNDVSFDSDDITYTKDKRTGICFAYLGSRKSGSASSTGLGFTCVPCEKVKHLIN